MNENKKNNPGDPMMEDLIFRKFHNALVEKRIQYKEIKEFKEALKARIQYKIIKLPQQDFLRVPLNCKELIFLIKFSFQHGNFSFMLEEYLKDHTLVFSQYFTFRFMLETILNYLLKKQLLEKEEIENFFFLEKEEKALDDFLVSGRSFTDILFIVDQDKQYSQKLQRIHIDPYNGDVLTYSESLQKFIMLEECHLQTCKYYKASNENEQANLEYDENDLERFMVEGTITFSSPYTDLIFLHTKKITRVPSIKLKYYYEKGIPLRFQFLNTNTMQQEVYSKDLCETIFQNRLLDSHQVLFPNDQELYYLLKPKLANSHDCMFCEDLAKGEYNAIRIGNTHYYNWMHTNCLHEYLQFRFQKRKQLEDYPMQQISKIFL